MQGILSDRARIKRLFDLTSDVYETRGGRFDVDPYPTFRRLLESGPVHRGAPHEELGWTGETFFQGLPYPNRPHFTVYDYETCAAVLKDERRFVTSVPPLEGEPPLMDAGMLFMDGRRHRDYRALVQPSFVPARAMWWLNNWISGTIDELVASLDGRAGADLNPEFCAPIPLLTITGSFGITVEEALDVRAAVTSDGQGLDVLARLLTPIIAERRRQPTDDLISILVQAEMTDEDGNRQTLSDGDVLGFSLLLLAAGSGTTWKQMGITLVALLSHPEALAAARLDPAFMRQVIEESLRWTPTDPVFARFVAEDCQLGGVDIPAGSVIHVCLASANRDPSRWDRPDEFDPFRTYRPHIGFGHGPHTCLGMHVARAEMTHGIGALLSAFPHLRIDPDAPAPRMVGLYERGLDAIPVRLD